MAEKKPAVTQIQKGLAVFGRGAKNALEVMREGRIGSPYRAPHDIAAEERTFRLRHYRATPDGPGLIPHSILLVPPLMVSSEVYDISPELSAVSFLTAHGVDVWLVDFGAPEHEEGGMERTLDDHVLAVDRCVDLVREATGEAVHLLGYSQGGMFVYQCAAYRKSEGLASVITMGSPVDIWRNIPVRIHDEITEKVLEFARAPVAAAIAEIEGLPGAVTSAGFKLLSARKEIRQFVDLLGMSPDKDKFRQASNEPKRRFLGGEGFVAWPGPAFRKFVDDMIVNNRMASGGFVIAGRTVGLGDITCPILCFVGERDDLAFPAAVRAIHRAAPRADIHERAIGAGHFGLVVGSKAMGEVWPTVAEWVAWKAGVGERPAGLGSARNEPPAPAPAADNEDVEAIEVALHDVAAGGVRGLYDLATEAVDSLWKRMGDASLEVSEVVDALRWQLPRLAKLKRIDEDSRMSVARVLADQAAAIPERTFFLWHDKAFSYREADVRVNQVLTALVASGVRTGQHVGVLMGNGPDFLTVVAAINRMGAVGVLLNAGARGKSLDQAIEAARVEAIVADAGLAAEAERALPGKVFLLGKPGDLVPEGVTDLDTLIDPAITTAPAGVPINQGKARDLAFLLFTSGTTGLPRAARVTNRRWALAALGGAATCRLTWKDTVYCCLPLHHATGLLVAVGGALVSGARLALEPRFSAEDFWPDVRRYGATVVFYVGEVGRYLVSAPVQPGEDRHPVRLFAGNGMSREVWERLQRRFGGVQVLEFYSSTEGNVALTNLSGEKRGAVGRPLPGTADLALVRYDAEQGAPVRSKAGRLERVASGETGLLLARVSDEHPLARFDGYLDPAATENKTIRDAFDRGDEWFNTGDLLRRDDDGDYWFVDRIGDTFRWKGENVSTEQVAQVLGEAPFVALAVVYGITLPGREGRAGMAAVELTAGATFDGQALFSLVEANLPPAARPRFVRIVEAIELTSTFKPVKRALREDGADPARLPEPLFFYDEPARAYTPLDPAAYAALIG